MDYREKMVVVPQTKIKTDDDDDEDLETLRMVALQSIRAKDTARNRQPILPQITQPSRIPYKNQRPIRRNFHYNRTQQRQNGNVYYQSPRNPNLIAIVPVDEPSPLQQIGTVCPVNVEKTESKVEPCPQEISKFHRFKDNGSASEDEDTKESKNTAKLSVKTEVTAKEEPTEALVETETQEEVTETSQKNGEDQEEDGNDDDDDILLMADLEEEDSLERLMDEMEREMNVGKPLEKKEKKSSKGEGKNLTRHEENSKATEKPPQRTKSDESCSGKKDRNNVTTASSLTTVKSERRSVSPHIVTRVNQKRRSLSPRSRPRKKSPRRSPRRSPPRQSRRSPRELMRYRSPRRSPSRYSPRPRSPKLSPRRSPNRTLSTKRSPLRKLSPRGRSPKLSSRSRSPRPLRSRSPRRLSRSKSPRPRTPKVRSRSRSPRLSRSRTPRSSPLRLSPPLHRSPKSKSPRSPSRRTPPRRLPSRSRSPGLSPLRRGSSRLQSPKVSPRRTPRRSPWSSPRNSPRLPSPRRRRSPKWSPKELPRKHGPRSATPDNPASLYAREPSPSFKSATTPEMARLKSKQKDEQPYEKPVTTMETAKEPVDVINDPVLEARRKKFESTRPIDPVNANKKIKLCKKHTATKIETSETIEIQLGGMRKINKSSDEYDIQEVDLCLETSYEFEELEGADDASSGAITSSINTCIDVEPQKAEEKPPKKRKKRDKELYQVGKLKSELPLSERIGKEKCKKRKEIVSDGPSEDVDAIFEDLAIDEEGDLRAELSRRRAERLNRTVPIQSARLVQSAFKGVVNEVVKNNAKANQRHVINTDEKTNQKEVRRVTVLHRSVSELHDSEDETTLDSKVPVRFRLGLNKQESRESKVTRKAPKRQGRKVKHKNHMSLKDPEHIL
ncbi:serine/arginine repetitive matrix protein 2-like isoform X1 [Harpegnathos saltator]|uniref:serine/arginine repetitive matrix protein 2-like isoform X1 n=1 Tax=Harpegnathos saltator TaxID=610380 RepID=UPI00058C4043|nr:serine/arginine repetitive matrix protein 2-like isoform X1 [Harpegnathos saltator]